MTTSHQQKPFMAVTQSTVSEKHMHSFTVRHALQVSIFHVMPYWSGETKIIRG